MSYTETLVRGLCNTLWTTVVRNSAQDWRFAQWLQMPLPRNEYWDLVQPKPSGAQRTVATKPVASESAESMRRRMAVAPADGNGRTRVIESLTGSQVHAVVPSNGMQTISIATDARAVMMSVDATLSDERALALRVMDDATHKHFDFSRPGVVPKITQLLLVLALEPCQLSLEFVLRKRFDDDFVVRNFLAQSNEPVPPADVVAWHRDVKRMAFNLFGRFPELALNCDIGSDVAQLRAVQHLWCLAEYVFRKCTTTLHSESAHQFAFDRLLDDLARDRTPLLEAVARANIYAAGTDPGRFLLRRDLFAEAFVCAQLHVLQLQSHATPDSDVFAHLGRALASLKLARAAAVLLVPQ